jgi:NADPH:quinone reductase-like Zn-dependent oxidoreductase
MRAAVYTRYGPPDRVLRFEHRETPEPGDGELLVRVHAATVNRTDCGFLRGKPSLVRLFAGLRTPRQPVLGNEFAGDVVAVGANVDSFAVGDRVFGFDGITFGAHADYLTTRADGFVAVIPTGMSYEESAPSTEGAHYSLNLIRAAGITAGQTVLVNGATGAIGSAAVQLLANVGARVTAVCGPTHIDLVASLGADRVIDYTATDFTRLDDRFDVVVDAVGKSSFRRCRSILKRDGIYLSSDLGFLGQNPILALTTRFLGRKRVMFPIPRVRQSEILYLKELLAAGTFRAVVDRSYSFDQIVEAYRYVESGVKVGSVLLRVTDAP